jgi:UDP-N-acetylmuramate--alanine ligase
VGGVMTNYGINARAGKGSPFVIEADEYDRMFLGLKPRIAVVTNVEHDHPDCFPSYEDIYSAFESFVDLLPVDGTLVACSEDAGAAQLLARARQKGRSVMAYGLQSEMTINSPQWLQARNARPNDLGGFTFNASGNMGESMQSVQVALQVPGEHNVRNALAALAVVSVLGLSVKDAAHALGDFKGTGRRFEVRGEKKGVTVIDDYAHHPTEIRATLAASRARYPKRRLWAVWQPHTYSRTKTLFYEFTRAFSDADQVLVTEIFAAREARQDFSAAEVVSSMTHPAVRFTGGLEDTTRYLLKHLHSGDVLLVLSAGDADLVSTNVLAAL